MQTVPIKKKFVSAEFLFPLLYLHISISRNRLRMGRSQRLKNSCPNLAMNLLRESNG